MIMKTFAIFDYENLCDLCGNFAHLAVKKSWFLQFSTKNKRLPITQEAFFISTFNF